jgi:hypothetical protein
MSLRRLCAAAAGAVTIATVAPVAAAPAHSAPAVIAVVGEAGANVLHDDFRAPGGRTPAYPKALGRVISVSLPASGSFAQRIAAVKEGVLGHLRPGIVYGIRGTRLLVVSAPSESPATDVTGSGTTQHTVGAPDDPMLHGTGVVDAAIGTRYGTAPDALALLVLGGQVEAWDWLVAHGGIDIVNMSGYEPVARALGCQTAVDVRRFVAAGGMVFSSSGNTTDAAEQLEAPNGLPEVYHVGGVRDDGAPWGVPPAADPEPFYAIGQVTRPYETGELYSFPTASYSDTSSTMRFGGTSGATPRTAGRAATLLMNGRSLLAGRVPTRGPLADHRLTAAEIEHLLRHVAVPYYATQHPAAFAVEGYGYLNAASEARAIDVLRGTAAEPGRAQDDQVEQAVEQARAAAFTAC